MGTVMERKIAEIVIQSLFFEWGIFHIHNSNPMDVNTELEPCSTKARGMK